MHLWYTQELQIGFLAGYLHLRGGGLSRSRHIIIDHDIEYGDGKNPHHLGRPKMSKKLDWKILSGTLSGSGFFHNDLELIFQLNELMLTLLSHLISPFHNHSSKL